MRRLETASCTRLGDQRFKLGHGERFDLVDSLRIAGAADVAWVRWDQPVMLGSGCDQSRTAAPTKADSSPACGFKEETIEYADNTSADTLFHTSRSHFDEGNGHRANPGATYNRCEICNTDL